MRAAESIEAYFEGKPESLAIFRIVADRIAALGPAEISVASQISFGQSRKFAWFWLYNVTRSNPDGVPHLMLALDHRADSDRPRRVSQVGKDRWNHQVVLRSRAQARSRWLGGLLKLAYEHGTR